MPSINRDTHQLTDFYCPYCYHQLVRVKTTDAHFCSHPSLEVCDYEWVTAGEQPLGLDERNAAVVKQDEESAKKLLQHALEVGVRIFGAELLKKQVETICGSLGDPQKNILTFHKN